MATSEVEICNSALNKLGADTIISLDEDTTEGRLCKIQYPLIRDEVLRSHPWNFAVSRKALSATTETPAFKFSNQFLIPSDVLRILETDIENVDEEFQIETSPVSDNRVLVTNDSAVNIRYIKAITNVTLFDKNFVEVLALRLASDMAYPLLQDKALAQSMFALYENQLRQARTFDAQEGSVRQVESDEWFDARF